MVKDTNRDSWIKYPVNQKSPCGTFLKLWCHVKSSGACGVQWMSLEMKSFNWNNMPAVLTADDSLLSNMIIFGKPKLEQLHTHIHQLLPPTSPLAVDVGLEHFDFKTSFLRLTAGKCIPNCKFTRDGNFCGISSQSGQWRLKVQIWHTYRHSVVSVTRL